jgi:large subunit ribosomal protein L7/L12
MAEETAKPEEVKEEVAEAAAEKTEEKKDESTEAEAKAEVPAKFKDLVSEIEKLSVLDLSELVKVLEDHFGVSAAAPVAMAAAGGGGEAAEAVEEKSEYNIFLAGAGEKKIDVIKAVREITGLGLAESKALVGRSRRSQSQA